MILKFDIAVLLKHCHKNILIKVLNHFHHCPSLLRNFMDTIHHAVEDKDSHKLVKKGKKKRTAPKDGMGGQLAKGKGEDIKDNGLLSVHSQKKEQKNIEEMPEHHEPNQSEIREVENKKKRKRHPQDDTSPQITKQARKGQEMQQGARSSPDSAIDNVLRPRKKKKDKKKSSSTIPNVKSLPIDEKPKKQKKHKNRTGFPNPEEDTDEVVLPDQAKKGVSPY